MRESLPVFLVYQIALTLALPAIVLRFLWLSRREPGYRRHLAERFGFGTRPAQGAIWIAGASLGEVRAAAALIRTLHARGAPVHVLTLTPAGRTEAARIVTRLGPGASHSYAPIDHTFAVRRALEHGTPIALVYSSPEIWPATLRAARTRALPLVATGVRRVPGPGRGLRQLVEPYLGAFDLLCTVDDTSAAALSALGIRPERLAVTGDPKYDQRACARLVAAGRALGDAASPRRPTVLIANSAPVHHPALLELVARLVRARPAPRLIWAPRDQQSVPALASSLERGWALRSACLPADLSQEPASLPEAHLIADGTGEMAVWLALADFVVMAGPHSLAEPFLASRPVLTLRGIGPADDEAKEVGALVPVAGIDELARAVHALLGDPDALAERASAARALAKARRGATDRIVKKVERLLGP